MKDTYRDNFLIVQVNSISDKGVGDYAYRISQPSEAMGLVPGVMVVNLASISPYLREICLMADILVLHLTGEIDMLPIVAERKRRGLATVYEISDNFMAFPPWVEIRSWFSDPVNLATSFQLISLSDAIQGVSEILIEKFHFLQARRVVFENQIMEMGNIGGNNGDEVIMGWGGSLGHTEDIQWIAPIISAICRNHSRVRFGFMGNRDQYEKIFGGLKNNQFFYREPGSLMAYYNFLRGLDIGLAPLLDTPYNICRSDVKFIEFASQRCVPVVSDVGPYRRHARHGVNAFLFDSPESLGEILGMLIKDRSLLERVRNNAYDYVKRERLETKNAMNRISFYKELAKVRSSESPAFHLLERSSPGAEVYRLRQTPAEAKVIKGAYLEEAGHSKEAHDLWQEAACDVQGYSFPLLWLGRCFMEDDQLKAIEYFRRSIAANPASLRSRLLLGKTLRHTDREAAMKEFVKAVEVFPDFAPLWEEIGLMKKEDGFLDDAVRFMNSALKANPFYAQAAFELGKIYFEQQKRDLALEAFLVASDLIPDNPDYAMKIIETLIEEGRIEDAMKECLEYLGRNPKSGRFYEILSEIFTTQGKEQKATMVRQMALLYT